MDLDVGCGLMRCTELTVDIDRRVKPTILADARFLPFMDKTFERVYAFNVLEHIRDYPNAIAELQRVSKKGALIRLDKIFNLANWWTLEHEYIIYGRHFIQTPRILKAMRYILWFPITRKRSILKPSRLLLSCGFALGKIHLLYRWNYFYILREATNG